MRRAHRCVQLSRISLLVFFISATALARIGETPLQFIDRYGVPKDTPSSKINDKNFPILEGAISK